MDANLTTQISPSAAKTERAKLRRQRITVSRFIDCTRCGGAGQSDRWAFTGYVCFKCDGRGGDVKDVREYADQTLAERDAYLTHVIDQAVRDAGAADRAVRMAEIAAERYDEAWVEAHAELAVHTARAQQTYLGEIGTKIAATGTVLRAITVEGFYGRSRLIIVETADGNQVKTFGTGASLWRVERDDVVTISGTVKSHEMYEGDRQTVLTRTKIAAA